ncbi:MAG: hypothetical protein KKI02_01360 [Planctomycetes bacterium]|nr:hypothetical protein [Planctomycetota bacterium]
MDAIELAAFDDAAPYSLDPSVWAANLEALRAEQPELARVLDDTPTPPHWHPVTALDGFPTYRVEPPGEAAQWLAGTAAPATRAAGLLARQQFSSNNHALPSIAAGAQLSFLLDRLSSRQAVFVFEQDLAQLAAVLRTVSVAEAVAAGRCVLVPPGAELRFLEELLERHPGLLPPTAIVAPQLSDPKRLEQLRRTCETAARHTNESRERRLATLKSRVPVEASTRVAQPRLALVALGHSAGSHLLATQLAETANELGWSTCSRTANGPRHIHALPHHEALVDFGAELTVCIAHPPGSLPLPPGRPVCQWHLYARDIPASVPPDDTIHLAATPRAADALRAAGVPSGRLFEFYWACASASPESLAPSVAKHPRPTPPTAVAIVGDLPDASESACGIEQPTHRQLWKQLHQTATKAWETADITQPATLLRNAERTSRVNLGERSLHERMVRIIEHVLIPTVVLETILQVLRCESHTVLTVGRGWHRCSRETVQPLAESFDRLPAKAAETPVAAAIFAGPLDPLSPALFHAAKLGWPLLIHNPGKTPLTAQLGGILHPRQHYEPFAGSRDLCSTLDTMRSDPTPVQRRCERVREYLFAQHTYGQRLTALAQQLGLSWPGIEP